MKPVYSLDDFARELRELKSVLVCAHASPDADAVGSCCGLQQGLASLGVSSAVHFPEPLPKRMLSLVVGVPLETEVVNADFSALVVVDTATKERVGIDWKAWGSREGRVFNIDHHTSNEMWGDVDYVDSSASASAVIVYELLQSLKAEISQRTANLLYAGILDDTGCFRFSNTDSRSFCCAAELLDAGAVPQHVANQLYFSVPEEVLRLRTAALSTLDVRFDGMIAWISVTNEMLEQCGAKPEHTEGLVELARSLEGTVGAVFMRQFADGWKFSLRSKVDGLDVNAVAQTFGGGGHKAAAGCTILGKPEDAERQLIERLSQELADLG